ncbi:MAG: response regulator [Candidatus Omnitrophica bacterium]|nr:response regulator [Candidatus Omnitrophota bacterium]
MRTIYIVDDDESVRRALRLLTVACGFKTETFSSAEEFFGVVPNSSSGCLILDIYMPGLSGWDAQKRVQVESSRPVILMSADKDGDFKDRANRVGAFGYLQKPFHDQELIDLLGRVFLN